MIFTDLISKINRVNDVVTEQKKQKDIEDVIESVIKDPIPTNKYWWEDDIFSKTDKQPTIDATKIIVDDIKQTTNDALKDIYMQALSDNFLRNLRPVGNRNIQQLIDDDFIPIDDRTQQEREDDDNISLLSEDDNISLLSKNDDAVTIEDVVEPTFTTNTAIVEPTTTSNTPKNHFIVTIENVLEPPATVNQIPSLAPSKTLDVDINALSNNILKNLQPVDNRNIQQLIEDNFIRIDDRTQQEREDDDNISLEGKAPPIIDIDTTSAWDQNKTEIARPGPIIKLSTDYDRKVKVAKKVKNKYLKKKIGQINTQNKASKDWLKSAGFLDTKDQDKINYIFVPPKKVEINKIPGDAAHFIRTEIDSTDFKKENLATKIRRNKNIRKPYKKMPDTDNKDKDETIQILDDIAILEPGKNAQIAAKKISEKYRLIRQENGKKKFKLPGEIVTIETIKTPQGDVKVPVSVPKKSSQKAAKRMKDKYAKIRQNKAKSKKIVESNKRNKILKEIDTIKKIRTASDKKRTRITADKKLKKYKNMKRLKKTYLVNEEDIKTIDYTEPQEDLFAGESIVNAAKKVLDFKKFKKEQEKELKKGKKGKQVAAKNILKNTKTLKNQRKHIW